jgi:lipoprotein-releasing system ATP-binding protein
MGALDIPERGQVTFEGTDVFAGSASGRDHHRNIHFGFVFQFYHLLPELTTLENALMPAMVRYSVLGWLRHGAEVRGRACQLLEEMGLSGRLRHRPNELSGGEMQRVAIARALINQPPVLLADEPTGNLDSKTGEGILGLLKALNEKGQTIVMVTHDSRVAAAAHRTVTLVDGRIKTPGE